MTRLPALTDRDDVSPEGREIFDGIMAMRGRVGGPFALLMHSPRVVEHVSPIGHYLRFESPLPAADRELATLTAARETDCAFEWAAHYQLALDAGAPQAALDAIANRAPLDGLDEAHALPVRYVRELLLDHRLSDATFDAARARYGEQGVMELTALVGYYSLIAAVLNAMEAPAPEGAPALP